MQFYSQGPAHQSAFPKAILHFVSGPSPLFPGNPRAPSQIFLPNGARWPFKAFGVATRSYNGKLHADLVHGMTSEGLLCSKGYGQSESCIVCRGAVVTMDVLQTLKQRRSKRDRERQPGLQSCQVWGREHFSKALSPRQ